MKPSVFLSLFISLFILHINIVNAHENFANQYSKNQIANSQIKYFNFTNISYGLGIGTGIQGSDGHSLFGFHTINGCILASKVGIGIGIGLDRLRLSENLEQTKLPVFLDLKYYFLKEAKILFLGIEGGYSHNIDHNDLGSKNGGFFIDSAIGIKTFSIKKTSFTISLGINILKNTIQNVWTPLPEQEKFFNIKTGVLF